MLNKVILIGNVGQDPEIRSLPNGGRVSNFSLATTEYWKDKSGNKNSKTEWHKIVTYSENIVKLLEKAVHKGSKLYLEGSISTRKYTDQSGNERTIYEIIVNDTIRLLDARTQSGDNNYTEKKKDDSASGDKFNNSSSNSDDHHDDSDDEIPF